MKQNITLFNFKRGEKMPIATVNAVLLATILKINALIPPNVRCFTTGQFSKTTFSTFTAGTFPLNLIFPNYCGRMYSSKTAISYMEPALSKLNTEISEVLKRL